MKVVTDYRLGQEENSILRQVQGSPFVVKLFASFRDKKRNKWYLIQECGVGSLYAHLRKKKRLKEATVKFLASELIAGLRSIHNKDIVIRDIKPENIVLTPEGHIRIIDFGLGAKSPSEEESSPLCGTPEYMSPETINATTNCRKDASDWWALGVLLYELLTGKTPFRPESNREALPDDVQLEVFKKISKANLKFPKEANISKEAKECIRMLLEKSPKKRMKKVGDNGSKILLAKWFVDVDWQAVENGEVSPPSSLKST